MHKNTHATIKTFDGYRLAGYVAFAVGLDGTTNAAKAEQAKALALAIGAYQRALLNGSEASSGGTLIGKASKYVAVYRESRDHLFARMRAAGIRFTVRRFRGTCTDGLTGAFQKQGAAAKTQINRDVIVFGDPAVAGTLDAIADLLAG